MINRLMPVGRGLDEKTSGGLQAPNKLMPGSWGNAQVRPTMAGYNGREDNQEDNIVDPIIDRFAQMARDKGFSFKPNMYGGDYAFKTLKAISEHPDFGGDLDNEFLYGIAKDMGITARELSGVPPSEMMGPKGPSGLPRPLRR